MRNHVGKQSHLVMDILARCLSSLRVVHGLHVVHNETALLAGPIEVAEGG